MSFVIDASAAIALHFTAEKTEEFSAMEEHLISEKQAFTAPNFFQEVMEALRKGIRDGRTTQEWAAEWLTLLDQFQITPVSVHPCAGSATWLIIESLNISPYDAGYLAVAKSRGLPIFSLDQVVVNRASRIGVTVNPRKF